MSRRGPRRPSLGLSLALALVILSGGAAQSQNTQSTNALARARALVEEQRASEALTLLLPLADGESTAAEASLLISYCHFILGDEMAGKEALDRSLTLDPARLEAWQIKGALELDDERFDEAVEAFTRAQELDPEGALKYELNIGAALLLQGSTAEASRHFNRYLAAQRSSGQAYFLVAKNYALTGQWDLVVQHLEAAATLDERIRRQARSEPNFLPMAEFEPYQRFLATDSYKLPPGAHHRVERFEESYDGGHGDLLKAVLNALQLSGRPFDREVEVTPGWALIWADTRIKVRNAPDGGGQLELSAPLSSFTPSQWLQHTDELFGEVREQLALLGITRR